MNISITSKDAFLAYRSGACDGALDVELVPLPTGFTPSLSLEEAIELHRRYGTLTPLSCAVQETSCRRHAKTMVCHVLDKKIPKAQFACINEGLFLSSPELCIFEMRHALSQVNLVLAISEMCSGYALPASGKGPYRNRRPLSNLSSMTSFISNSKGARRIDIMSLACSRSIEYSNSILETALALLLSFPPELGGYGLPKPSMNSAVCGFEGKRPPSFVLTGDPLAGVLYGDLVFEEQRLVVEYLSKTHHQGRWDEDAIRLSELTDAGWKSITVTPAQLFDNSEMHNVAKKIANALNRELPEQTAEWLQANQTLHGHLLSGRSKAPLLSAS